MLKKISGWLRNWRHKEALPLKLDNYWVFEIKTEGKVERQTTRVTGIKYFPKGVFFKLEGFGCDDNTWYRNTEEQEVEKIFYYNNEIWTPGTLKVVTKPVEDHTLYVYKNEDGSIYAGAYATAVADDSVINGFQCTCLIEETRKYADGRIQDKMILYWGDGIGYIKIDYFRTNKEGVLELYQEQLLVECQLW